MIGRWGILRLLSVAFATCVGVLVAAGGAIAQDDGRLSQEAFAALARAAKEGNYAALETRQTEAIFRRLAASRLDRLQGLTDQVYVLRASRYLPLADRVDPNRRLSGWLLANRDVTRLLFRAMQDANGAEGCLRRFADLLNADERKVLAYGHLSVAFATSNPLSHYVRQPKAATMLESFAWYTDPKSTFRYDLKAMPFEFSRYLADTRLGIEERKWAMQKYGSLQDLGSIYFQVTYDYDYFFKGTPKKIGRVAYTLPNLALFGGICLDQAYFAAEACKAVGVPASIIHGHTVEGDPHAWLACLKVRKTGNQTQAEWDAQTGRYEEYKFYTGMVTDPASGEKLHDSELMLLGAAALLPLERREEADAATALAALAASAVKKRPAGCPASVKPEPAWVERLIFEAVNRNLARRQTWDLVVRLRKAGELSTDCMDRLFDFLVTRTAKDYPDYGCTLMIEIVPTYEPARREKIYQRAMELYARRPDLQGHLLIAAGDDYLSQGKKDLALGSYKQVFSSHLRELTELILIAAKRTEDVLRSEKHLDQAIALYRELFAGAPKPQYAPGYQQSVYYQLGKRLADLLAENAQKDEARTLLKKLAVRPDPEVEG